MKLNLTSGPLKTPDRICIYGTGGIGKSTLAAWLPGPVFLDLERGTSKLNVTRDSCDSWPELRGKIAAIRANPPAGAKTIVIDSATKAEEYAREHVVATRRTDKGKAVDSIEGFGWGKGWQFVHEEFCAMLADLDGCVAAGLNVCLIAHDVSSPVPNPSGEDFLRWEPRLYAGDKKGRGSIRDLVHEWAEHVLFIGYDVHVEDGKGQGSGSRTIYTYELPTHRAKSRSAQKSVPFTTDKADLVWRELGVS